MAARPVRRARLIGALLSPLLGACGGDPLPKQPPQCSSYTCPVGTYADEYRLLSDESKQYVNVIEGECRYSCVAAQSCPEGWWPIITADCFSCATVLPSGDVLGGECDPDNWALWYEEAPPEDGPPRCRSSIQVDVELEEPDDTREQATDLGTVRGGVRVEGAMSITNDTYYCGEGNSTGTYGEVDWFRFHLDCTDTASFELRGDLSTPSLFVYQDGELVAAPETPGEPMPFLDVADLSGDVEVGVACWDASYTGYSVEITF